MTDTIERIGNSIIQHGKNSDRIYLMSLNIKDLPGITLKLEELANKNGYTKIIVKAPVCHKGLFEMKGYKTEAVIPKLYNGDDGCFICKYLDSDRSDDLFRMKCSEILQTALQKDKESCDLQLPEGFVCRQANERDISAMVELYKRVFESYPFPIHEEEYILKTMRDNVIYFGIWNKNKLVALSSIECTCQYSNAEMTDFAVLEEYRGNGFARYLLIAMEKKLRSLSVKTAYTIARAKSAGMNITFAKNGYTYAGTLINNTDISGQIESMNVWYKYLLEEWVETSANHINYL
ncbi:MAG: putative beta-lysine N-acetyltransferase [Anaerocolumna sp.]